MHNERILGPYERRPDYDEDEHILQAIEDAKNFLLEQLQIAYAIPSNVFAKICMFSIIDLLAQEYYNYPSFKSGEKFKDFVL